MSRLIAYSTGAIALVFLLGSRTDGVMIYPSQLPSAIAKERTSVLPSLGATEAHRLGPWPLENDVTLTEPSKPNTFEARFWTYENEKNEPEVPMSVKEGKTHRGTLVRDFAPKLDSGTSTQSLSLFPAFDPAFIDSVTREVDVSTPWILSSDLGGTPWPSTWSDLSALSAMYSQVASLLPSYAWSAKVKIESYDMGNSWPDQPVSLTPAILLPGTTYVSAPPSLPLPTRESPDPLRNDPLPDDAMPSSSGTEVLERARKRADRELISDIGNAKSGRATASIKLVNRKQ